MADHPIRFDDGDAYERYMGTWSQLVGGSFLEWLAPGSGLRWLDVGCGNGAFTELVVDRCAPSSVDGIDPSEAQLAFARTRAAARMARFRDGDAMALPFPDRAFDVAVMPLVIFFVPEPARGLAEMVRVVSPGGLVAAYAWDMLGGGFPYDALLSEMRALGMDVPSPPRPEASRLEVLQELWASAGLDAIDARAITVRRTFPSFEDFWAIVRKGPSVGPSFAAKAPELVARLRERVQARLPTDGAGAITYEARAHAIKGRVPTDAPSP